MELRAAGRRTSSSPSRRRARTAYKVVGQVIGVAAANDDEVAQVAAKNDLRNKAAALGASLVTIDENLGEAVPLSDKTKVKLVGPRVQAGRLTLAPRGLPSRA